MTRSRIASQRGTTIVEIMMALTMLAIGASGIIAMQKVTTVANRDARNLQTATEIARTWVERIRSDSMLWNYDSDISTDTLWLKSAQAPGTSNWFRPENSTLSLHGVHNALGKDDQTTNRTGPFCVNLRLTRLKTQGKVVRAEVRVYWLRSGIQMSGTTQVIPNPLCNDQPPSIEGSTQIFHAVHMTTAVRQNEPY